MLRYLIFCSLCFFHSYVFAQSNAAEMRNATELLPEKILVHTDKDFYICGEIMWVKVYVVNKENSHLQNLSKTAYVELLGKGGHPVYQSKLSLKDGMGDGSILLPDSLPSGMYELRIYTNWMKNRPESFYRKYISIVNTQKAFDTTSFKIVSDGDSTFGMMEQSLGDDVRSDAFSVNNSMSNLVTISSDKALYGKRSPVKLKVGSLSADSALTGHLSIAVFKLNSLTQPGGLNNAIPKDLKITDMQQSGAYVPEMNGYIVRVKATQRSDNNPAVGVPVMLSLTGKLADVKYGETDEKGVARFSFKGVFGATQLFLKTTSAFENEVDLQVLSPFVQFGTTSIPMGLLRQSDLSALEEMHHNLSVSRAFDSGIYSPGLFYPENADSISFYGTPYKTYYLDDYKRFVTMEEVLREYVMEVNVRIRKDGYFLPILSEQNFKLYQYITVDRMTDKNGPLILIDGIPVSANELMRYDPLKVRKLDVIADRFMVGKLTYDGILSFTTYKGSFQDVHLGEKELLVDDKGWQYHRKFFMPDYSDPEIKNNRKPDFRSLLYWDPNVKISSRSPAEISFYTGDQPGDFIAILKGVTGDGHLVFNTILFRVE